MLFRVPFQVLATCYEAIRLWGIDIGVVDRILVNFNRTAGLFRSVLYTKLFAVLLLALSCLGTKGVKGEKITWRRIWTALAAGFVLFFLNWWILELPFHVATVALLYILTLSAGYICLLMGGLWMSRLLKHNLMDDVFNNENESFMQETRLLENDYSVNLPTRFYYRKKWHQGWINVVNPFRATIVLGTPGSGKSYAVVNSFIKQQIEKGYSQYIYDFKYPDLSTIAYNHLLNHLDAYRVKPKFYVINFDDPRRSHRCNPIHPDFMTDIADAYESAYTIMPTNPLPKKAPSFHCMGNCSHIKACWRIYFSMSGNEAPDMEVHMKNNKITILIVLRINLFLLVGQRYHCSTTIVKFQTSFISFRTI